MGPPTTFAILLVLSAAFLHAFWNAIIKGSSDRVLTMGLINLGHLLPSIVIVLLYMPPAQQAWPFLVASTIIHFMYYGCLLWSYRFGDLSQVYPIARGSAPVLVALGAQVFAGEILPPIAWVGILLVSFGIGTLFLEHISRKMRLTTLIAAILTGVTIASYSIVDGMGVRVSQSPLGYIGWLFLLESIAGFVFIFMRRNILPTVSLKQYSIGLAGGMISGLAYGLAIYAKSLTTLGTVSAIRESSVIIAAFIGVVWFGERPWKLRVIAAIIVASGVALLATAS
ncbi:MAG: EamA family transporter [Pseudomonadota bacterium]